MRRTLFSMLSLASCAMGAGDAITIHVVDGKTGKPVANEHVLVFYGDSEADIRAQKHHSETHTDSTGGARLSGTKGFLEVWVDGHPLCERSISPFSVDAIQSSGIVAPNTCGSATHVKVRAELYLFVRKETFIEGMRH